MKKISNTSKTLKKSQNKSWLNLWDFSLETWVIIGGIILFICCFLPYPAIGKLLFSFFSIFDIRTWPWWYFICLLIMVLFSIKWYLFYQKYVNKDFDPQSSDECKWFCILSGTVTAIIGLIFFLYWTSLLKRISMPLYLWFRYGSVSFSAFLIILVIIGVIVGVTFLVWKWLTTLPE